MSRCDNFEICSRHSSFSSLALWDLMAENSKLTLCARNGKDYFSESENLNDCPMYGEFQAANAYSCLNDELYHHEFGTTERQAATFFSADDEKRTNYYQSDSYSDVTDPYSRPGSSLTSENELASLNANSPDQLYFVSLPGDNNKWTVSPSPLPAQTRAGSGPSSPAVCTEITPAYCHELVGNLPPPYSSVGEIPASAQQHRRTPPPPYRPPPIVKSEELYDFVQSPSCDFAPGRRLTPPPSYESAVSGVTAGISRTDCSFPAPTANGLAEPGIVPSALTETGLHGMEQPQDSSVLELQESTNRVEKVKNENRSFFESVKDLIGKCFSPSKSPSAIGGGQKQLWQFLLELLDDPEKNSRVIAWEGDQGEFRFLDPEEVARMWGEVKSREKKSKNSKSTGMSYDKLSRSLRYYYDRGIMSKVSGRRYTYKFDFEGVMRACAPTGVSDSRFIQPDFRLDPSNFSHLRNFDLKKLL